MIPAVELTGVSKSYRDVRAVRDVSLRAHKGEILGLVGPSGAGKSTLLRIIDLLEPPDRGDMAIDGTLVAAGSSDAAQVRRRMGMVLQKPVALNRSVWNNLAYALRIRGVAEEEIVQKVTLELKGLGLSDRNQKNARTLSGGEMQRLCFARATIYGPEILLLDEFAANLDPPNVALLEAQLRSFMEESEDRCVIMVTHNLFQAKRLCDKVALMWDGEIVELADRDKFFENADDPRTAGFVSGELVY
jgi:tungstate transport system ATP-binding protein